VVAPIFGSIAAMKIRVQCKDGTTEILTFRGPIEVAEGRYMNRLSDGSGIDHYFLRDGSYDGWGRADCSDAQTGHDTIQAMEKREKSPNRVIYLSHEA
jgi:hypothetical protein